MTEGNTTKLLLTFAWPMLIGNLFQQLYNLVDSVVVGKFIGKDALASIGATNSVSFLFFALCNGIGNGGGIVTSQYFGKGDTKLVKSSIANVGYIMLVFPAIIGTIAYIVSKPLLILLKTPENLLADSVDYYRTVCLGIVFISMYNFISAMLRALGDSKTPLYFLIFSCVLNTGLDVLFVKTFGMGVKGAGIATVISQFVSAATCMIYAFKTNSYFKLEKDDWKFRKNVSMHAIKLGVPLSLQFSLIAVSTMALQRVVNSFGDVAVAAFTATSRVEQIIHQPYQTLSAALSTYTGQNYGAGKKDRLTLGLKKGMLLMTAFTVIMLIVMQVFSKGIISIFIKADEVEVIEMGSKALKITSLFYIFLGIIYTVRGVLNGMGDIFFALYNGIVEVIGRFIVPVSMTSVAFIGIWGIWWSVGVVWFISGLTAWLRYISFNKKVMKKIEEPV